MLLCLPRGLTKNSLPASVVCGGGLAKRCPPCPAGLLLSLPVNVSYCRRLRTPSVSVSS